jgi:hypothetical protein
VAANGVIASTIVAADRTLAPRGHAVETAGRRGYDGIRTSPGSSAPRRDHAIMAALRGERGSDTPREIPVATGQGRAF